MNRQSALAPSAGDSSNQTKPITSRWWRSQGNSDAVHGTLVGPGSAPVSVISTGLRVNVRRTAIVGSAALDAAVAARRDDGTLLRAKVWRRDGTVLWSDDHSLIGRRFPLSAPVAAVFNQGRDHAEITRVSGADAAVESGRSTDLVEAFFR